ncbi:MAG: alpha/beta hydrolase [Phycisphaerales bacterium]|nr:MAG: alpha/beta hydrolase [Phycisphaerales bacterium]
MHLDALDLALFLLLGLVLVVGATILATAWRLAHPPRRTYASALARNRPGTPDEITLASGRAVVFTEHTFRHDSLDMSYWDVPGHAATTETSAPVIIMTHGWGDSRVGALARLPHLVEHASRLILWDSPGHGEAPGVCTQGLREPAALHSLLEHLQLPPTTPIVLYGWSMGAGVSIVVAASKLVPNLCGMIAESPYRLALTPARNVLRAQALPHGVTLSAALAMTSSRYATRFNATCLTLNPMSFDRATWAARVEVPMLVLQGDADTITPPQEAREIAAATPKSTLALVVNAGHNDLWTEPVHAVAAARAVAQFLASLQCHTTPRGSISTPLPTHVPHPGPKSPTP